VLLNIQGLDVVFYVQKWKFGFVYFEPEFSFEIEIEVILVSL